MILQQCRFERETGCLVDGVDFVDKVDEADFINGTVILSTLSTRSIASTKSTIQSRCAPLRCGHPTPFPHGQPETCRSHNWSYISRPQLVYTWAPVEPKPRRGTP